MYKSNKFCDILKISKGVTALTGSGGKTSLMMRLAEELCERGRTVICTTTHIMRPEGIPTVGTEEELETELELQDECRRKMCGQQGEPGKPVPVCIGSPAKEPEKLAAPGIPIGRLAEVADYVLVEADGARRFPLKCHAAHEPVIPAEADRVILVIGLSGIGKKVCEAVHRPELFKEYTGLGTEDTVTAAAVAEAVRAELPGIMRGRVNENKLYIFINQADTDEDRAVADGLAAELADYRCFAGAVRNGEIHENTHKGRG